MSRKSQILLIAVGSTVATVIAAWLATHRPINCGPQETREVTDMTSRAVRMPTQPQRILSLCSSATDTIVRLGQADKLAAIDEYNRIIPGAGQLAVIGKGSAISREQVLALDIDLAFIWWYQDDAAGMLEELSVPVVRIRSGRASNIPVMIRLVGECLNRPDAADSLADEVRAYIIKAAGGSMGVRPRVYLELYGPFKTAGSNSYVNDLIELAGGKNIAASASGSVIISGEHLIEADPDVILFLGEFTSAPAMADRPGLAGLSAVRAGRVRPIQRYWLVAGASLPTAVAEIRACLSKN